MEIDKDKVVECARAYVLRIDNEISKDPSMRVTEEYCTLRQAVNPPPPRPSKEECIKWLGSYLIGNVPEEPAQKIKTTIEYLKEPSLQWVKNMGFSPDCKTVLARLATGEFDVGGVGSFFWNSRTGHELDLLVEKYTILE